MENGNIVQFLEKKPDANRLVLLAQVASGLLYLHSLNPSLVHGDIKAANILIKKDEEACLTDFGLVSVAQSANFATTFSNQEGGSVRWMAPELHQESGKKTRESDVYAFGMTTLEVLTSQVPFPSLTMDFQVVMAVCGGKQPDKPEHPIISDGLWELMCRCWATDYMCRPSIAEVGVEIESMHSDSVRYI